LQEEYDEMVQKGEKYFKDWKLVDHAKI